MADCARRRAAARDDRRIDRYLLHATECRSGSSCNAREATHTATWTGSSTLRRVIRGGRIYTGPGTPSLHNVFSAPPVQ
jgi:hypothetical protein